MARHREQRATRFLTEDHLYARDLDIFGPGLAVSAALARPHAPRRRTARALAERAGRRCPTVRQRQEAIAELREALRFPRGARNGRRRVARHRHRRAERAGRRRRRRRRASGFAPRPSSWPPRSSARGVWWARGGPLSPLLVVILLKMVLTRPSRTRVARVVRGVERPLATTRRPGRHARAHRTGDVSAARVLTEIRARMMSHGVVPSEAIRRLKRLADMLDWRRNAIFAPICGDGLVAAAPCVGDRERGAASSARRSSRGCRRLPSTKR